MKCASYAKENLDLLWDEYKRSLNPEEYPVDLSQKCWDNKMRNIREVQEMVDEFINEMRRCGMMTILQEQVITRS